MRFEPESLTIEVHRSLDPIEEAWRALERDGVAPVYQTFDWVDAWQRHVGAPHGVEAMIVVGKVWGQPVFIWPMGRCRKAGIRIGHWLGGSHSNYNLGVHTRAAMLSLDRRRIEATLRQAASEMGIDLYMLQNQPAEWAGFANPFHHLDHQPSPSFARSVRLEDDFETYFRRMRSKDSRRKLRRKERFLEEAGPVELQVARTEDEILSVMEVFHEQKARQFADRGIHNLFDDCGVMRFFTDLAIRSLGTDAPRLEIYSLAVGGEVRAVWAGGESNGRCSGMFNSIATDDLSQYSPGSVLIMDLLPQLIERGVREFDLGIGPSGYKSDWCDRVDRMFDVALPITVRGHAAAHAVSGYLKLRRFAKNTPLISKSYDRLRRLQSRGITGRVA